MREVWKDVNGYIGSYQVSNKGRVKSLAREYLRKKNGVFYKIPVRERVLKNQLNKIGYEALFLRDGHTTKRKTVHRLVAEAFIDNPGNKPCVNHKDGNKSNNLVNNLEWVSYSENLRHSIDSGFQKIRGGEGSSSKLTPEIVREIRLLYSTGRYTFRSLGAIYNVSRTTIREAYARITWKHVS